MVSRAWIATVSFFIWTLENIFFYPKLKKFYRKRDQLTLIFDIGANKGQSINFFKKIFPQSQIIAFEPGPKIYKKLQKNVRKFTNIKLENLGVGAKSGLSEFNECALDETSTFKPPNLNSEYLKLKSRILFKSIDKLFITYPVNVTSLDDYFLEESSVIDLLKIDTEGFELEIIQGSEKLLKNKRINLIQLELHYNDMREIDQKNILELLNNYGFQEIMKIKHPFGSFYEVIFELSKQ